MSEINNQILYFFHPYPRPSRSFVSMCTDKGGEFILLKCSAATIREFELRGLAEYHKEVGLEMGSVTAPSSIC